MILPRIENPCFKRYSYQFNFLAISISILFDNQTKNYFNSHHLSHPQKRKSKTKSFQTFQYFRSSNIFIGIVSIAKHQQHDWLFQSRIKKKNNQTRCKMLIRNTIRWFEEKRSNLGGIFLRAIWAAPLYSFFHLRQVGLSEEVW